MLFLVFGEECAVVSWSQRVDHGQGGGSCAFVLLRGGYVASRFKTFPLSGLRSQILFNSTARLNVNEAAVHQLK